MKNKLSNLTHSQQKDYVDSKLEKLIALAAYYDFDVETFVKALLEKSIGLAYDMHPELNFIDDLVADSILHARLKSDYVDENQITKH